MKKLSKLRPTQSTRTVATSPRNYLQSYSTVTSFSHLFKNAVKWGCCHNNVMNRFSLSTLTKWNQHLLWASFAFKASFGLGAFEHSFLVALQEGLDSPKIQSLQSFYRAQVASTIVHIQRNMTLVFKRHSFSSCLLSLLSKALADYSQQFVVSVVLGKDLVPRWDWVKRSPIRCMLDFICTCQSVAIFREPISNSVFLTLICIIRFVSLPGIVLMSFL